MTDQAVIDAGAAVPLADFVSESHPWQLESGWLGVARTDQRGKRRILSLLVPGDRLGGLSGPDEPATNLIGFTSCLLTRSGEQQSAADRIADLTTANDRANQRISTLLFSSAVDRILHLLADLRMRLDLPARYPTVLPMPLSQIDLGDYLGITGVHVSRTFTELSRLGVAKWGTQAVQLLKDPATA